MTTFCRCWLLAALSIGGWAACDGKTTLVNDSGTIQDARAFDDSGTGRNAMREDSYSAHDGSGSDKAAADQTPQADQALDQTQADQALDQAQADQAQTDQAQTDQTQADQAHADQAQADQAQADQAQADQAQADQAQADQAQADQNVSDATPTPAACTAQWKTAGGSDDYLVRTKGKTYVFGMHSTQWSVTSDTGTVGAAIPLPSASSTPYFRSARMTPFGLPLFYYDIGTSSVAAHFDGQSFVQPVSVPLSVKLRADASGAIYGVDTSSNLWKATGTTTATLTNLGFYYHYDWVVSASGAVYVAYPSGTKLMVQAVHGATASANLTPSFKVDVDYPLMAAGSDGSLHVIYHVKTNNNGIYLYYQRSMDGKTWTLPEKVREPQPQTASSSTSYISPRLRDFDATNYDGAQALIEHAGGSMFGNNVYYLRRCSNTWQALHLTSSYGSTGDLILALDEDGMPSTTAGGMARHGY